MFLVNKEGVLETGPIRINKEIFQGDSLSLLFFTVSISPLNRELENTRYGYLLHEQTKINHLLYVDDHKLYGTSDNQMNGLLNTVKIVSNNIKLEFGLDKEIKEHFREARNWKLKKFH